MRTNYYVTRQVKFPQSTIQKCGFSQTRWVRVQFKAPQRKKGNFYIAKSQAFKDAMNGGRIIKKNDNYIVWKDNFGIYKAIWQEGHCPTNRYNDYCFAE